MQWRPVIELALTDIGTASYRDPMLAFEDAIREFGPDHLLIALRRADRAGWQEQGLLEGLLARYDLPLTVFTIGD